MTLRRQQEYQPDGQRPVESPAEEAATFRGLASDLHAGKTSLEGRDHRRRGVDRRDIESLRDQGRGQGLAGPGSDVEDGPAARKRRRPFSNDCELAWRLKATAHELFGDRFIAVRRVFRQRRPPSTRLPSFPDTPRHTGFDRRRPDVLRTEHGSSASSSARRMRRSRTNARGPTGTQSNVDNASSVTAALDLQLTSMRCRRDRRMWLC